MESLKSIYHNMSDMSKMLIKILLGIIIGLVAVCLLALLLRLIVGVKKDYSSTEKTMQSAAEKYYKNHSDELPGIGEEEIISTEKLIEEEYMKEMEKYVGKKVTCSGNVTVVNNDDYYSYIPYLDCGDKYKTLFLSDVILEDNDIIDSGDGLYVDENNNYVFRGEFVNNYLQFGNNIYRILKINNDGTIRILLTEPIKDYKKSTWDDRYNINEDQNYGINDFSISRIRETLEAIYNDDKIFSNNEKSLISKQTLCVGGRTQNSTDMSDTEECSQTLEGENLGLLQVNEFAVPSTDSNCTTIESRSCLNYNYLTSINNPFWTITPVANSTYENYRISSAVYTAKSSSTSNVLFTIHLNSRTQITGGIGTLEEPYVVDTYSK